MNTRFDYRTKNEFCKDIMFSTQLESYLFKWWMNNCKKYDFIDISNPRNNGVDNTGKFVENKNTAGADYVVDISYRNMFIKQHPVEVKWIPTPGKITLKVADLKAYIKEKASILFIYNSKKTSVDLRKPKDYNLDRHIKNIESISDNIMWAIMHYNVVSNFLLWHQNNNLIKPIYYMGSKPCIVLKESDFNQWFSLEIW